MSFDVPAAYSEWTSGRQALHLSTNAGSTQIAFQGWRRFKEAYAPELVCNAALETAEALGRMPHSCLDPFVGSGTTALTCQFLGIAPRAIEVNPYLADLTEAKLASYDVKSVVRNSSELFKRRYRLGTRRISSVFEDAPVTFFEPGDDGRYLFNYEVADKLAFYRERIREISDDTVRRLFLVLLASVAVKLSNATVSGKGRRYRRNWEERQASPAQVAAVFENAIERAVFDIRCHSTRPTQTFDLLRGDARKLTAESSALDLAVFSPPYPNSFDYTDVYNIELWIGGYLRSAQDNRKLREATLRSHVQIKRDYSSALPQSKEVIAVCRALNARRAELWNPHIPAMISSYFDDMNIVIANIAKRLVSGGRIYMAVGDSQYAGVRVPVAKILAASAERAGLTLQRLQSVRSMRASPQQGGSPKLPESLVVLSAP